MGSCMQCRTLLPKAFLRHATKQQLTPCKHTGEAGVGSIDMS